MRYFNKYAVIAIAVLVILAGCGDKHDAGQTPLTMRIPHDRTLHGDNLVDNYYWMQDTTRTNKDVLAYVVAENSYAGKALGSIKDLNEEILREMVDRVTTSDGNVSDVIDNYEYYAKTAKDQKYPVYCRKKLGPDTEEEIVLNVNEIVGHHQYFQIKEIEVSPDHRYIAFTVDTLGRQMYSVRIKDTKTGGFLDDTAYPVWTVMWSGDSKYLFYVRTDENAIYRHRLGEQSKNDFRLFQENGEGFFSGIKMTRDKKFMLFTTASETSNESYYLKANNPAGQMKPIRFREEGVKYYTYHHGDKFYYLTNVDGAENFKIMSASDSSPSKNWTDFIEHRDSVSIVCDMSVQGVEFFDNYLLLQERSNDLLKILVIDLVSGNDHYIDFPSDYCTFTTGLNANSDTSVVRFRYESLITPPTVYDYDMGTREFKEIKVQDISGGYDPSEYAYERLEARADDGTMIPISLMYKKDKYIDGSPTPMLLQAYGSYGTRFPATFTTYRLSLLDRGIPIAVAHVRGGGVHGKNWHEQGRLLNKMNTFTDLITCAEYLIAERITSSDKLALFSRGAGGLAVGGVLNMRPDLFAVGILDNPKVDILNYLMDPQAPGVKFHHEEWGNPAIEEQYHYIKSYDPYQNVKAQSYPPILVMSDFYGMRVGYWETAKWVAKLREMKTDDNLLLIRFDMAYPQQGTAAQAKYFRDWALKFAFLLDALDEN